MLAADDIRCRYSLNGAVIEALRGVSLTLAAGTVTVLRGASGSGKSSLFNILAGLTRPSAGALRLFGRDMAAMDDAARTRLRRQRVALIFQAYNLFPNLTALQNVAYPLARDGAADAGARAAAALARCGLAHRAGARPRLMSGGEQQRVAVARALAGGPDLLLADEPTGALDPENAEAVMTALARDTRERGSAVFMISHDPAALARADAAYELREGLLHAL